MKLTDNSFVLSFLLDITFQKIVHDPSWKVFKKRKKGKLEVVEKQELILEELCGRNRGKRTYSITPTETFELDSVRVSAVAKEKGFLVENLGDLGLSMRTNELSVNFMKRGSAVVVGSKDESDAVTLYKTLLSKN